MTEIINETKDEERAYYGLSDATVRNVTVDGPADGESAFKECQSISVSDSVFNLRYPFWHNNELKLENCRFGEGCRAPLWYTVDCNISGCRFEGVKALRECSDVTASGSTFLSQEFGWMSQNLTFDNCEFESAYFLFNSSNIKLKDCRLKGKYSFQYTTDLTLENCTLDTKDAFWHCTGAVIRNCTVKGEYLAWYSDSLTFIDCKIIGTQPFCYCTNLKLVNCEMIDTDLAFEYSEVDADIKGSILSVKNPEFGKIVADSYGEIILRDSVRNCRCEIIERKK